MNSCPVSTCCLPVTKNVTSHQHWLLERDRNKPLSRAMVSVRRNESEPGRSKKQVHSAILSSSLVSPYRQMKKLRTRVNDSQDLTASLL